MVYWRQTPVESVNGQKMRATWLNGLMEYRITTFAISVGDLCWTREVVQSIHRSKRRIVYATATILEPLAKRNQAE
jgi:hypothetical protein